MLNQTVLMWLKTEVLEELLTLKAIRGSCEDQLKALIETRLFLAGEIKETALRDKLLRKAREAREQEIRFHAPYEIIKDQDPEMWETLWEIAEKEGIKHYLLHGGVLDPNISYNTLLEVTFEPEVIQDRWEELHNLFTLSSDLERVARMLLWGQI